MSWIYGATKMLMKGKRVRETASLLSSGLSSARQYARDFSRTHFSYMWKEAGEGDLEAQFQLAECYFKGRGVEKNEQEAALWYERAARGGHARAQCNYAMIRFLGRGVASNPAEAWMWMKLSLRQNDLNASQTAPGLQKRIAEPDRLEGERMANEFSPVTYIFDPDKESPS
jgi:TPR repeat protein